jgi:hypothetical protein
MPFRFSLPIFAFLIALSACQNSVQHPPLTTKDNKTLVLNKESFVLQPVIDTKQIFALTDEQKQLFLN